MQSIFLSGRAVVLFILVITVYIFVRTSPLMFTRQPTVFDRDTFARAEGDNGCVSGHVAGMAPVCGNDGCLATLDVSPIDPPVRDVDLAGIERIPGWLQVGQSV